jgi:hypothetical protein
MQKEQEQLYAKQNQQSVWINLTLPIFYNLIH